MGEKRKFLGKEDVEKGGGIFESYHLRLKENGNLKKKRLRGEGTKSREGNHFQHKKEKEWEEL